MLANRQNHRLYTLMLGVGLLSGCAEEPVEPAPETMFPGAPKMLLQTSLFQEDCLNVCCREPEDGIAELRVYVENWLLAPHEECGDEPQCGPVLLTPPDFGIDLVYDFTIETVESTVTLDVLDIMAENGASLESWEREWWIEAHFVPRPDIDTPPLAATTLILRMDDEQARREHDAASCRFDPEHFYAYADLGPTTAPGTYVMRADLDDVEVACTFEVGADENGEVGVVPTTGVCAPEGLVTFSRAAKVETPDGTGHPARAIITPSAPVELIKLEVSRDGAILVEGSHEPGGDATIPEDDQCTLVPCLRAEPWGLTL